MPEEQRWSHSPLRDAIDIVTHNGRDSWQLVGWTLAGSSAEPTYLSDRISNPQATSGMRGIVFHPNGTSRNFTIRHDYDFAGGMPANGGKGYHVNVELPSAKYAFKSPTLGQVCYEDCVQMLSQQRLYSGDSAASQFFMDRSK